MANLKILFRTAGGRATAKQLGFGHVYRCINLALGLKSCSISFLIEDYGGVKQILTKNNIHNFSFLQQNIPIKQDIQTTKNYVNRNHVDIIIIDKYGMKSEYIKNLRKHTKVICISDLFNYNYPADLIVNGFIGFKNKIITNKYGTKCLLGPSFQILNKKFEKKINHTKKYDLLATFGGYDEKDITGHFIEALPDFVKKIKTKIILGPGTKKTMKIKKFEKKYHDQIEIITETNNMAKEISETKFGICAGGITTYEFARFNIPFAIVCDELHQNITAKEWERKGIAKNLGLISKNTKSKIENFLRCIEFGTLSLKKKKILDGKGTHRIVNQILKM